MIEKYQNPQNDQKLHQSRQPSFLSIATETSSNGTQSSTRSTVYAASQPREPHWSAWAESASRRSPLNTPTKSETDRPRRGFFWVRASSPARYEQSFRDIADYLKLPGRMNPQNNIFQLLCNWLRGKKSSKCVLILDNLNAASFLLHNPTDHGDGQRDSSDGQSQPLVSYLPYCQHGSILITTRSKGAALELV